MNETPLSPAQAREIDEICDRLEVAWKSGQRPNLEEYLETAAVPSQSALLRQILLLDWDYRRRAGEEPSPEEYHARFPNAGSVIEEVCREISESPESTWVEAGKSQHSSRSAAADFEQTNRIPNVENGSDRYDLLQEVGHGGIGVVFRGRDRRLGRELAVKVLRESYRDKSEARHRFNEEARVGSRLQHPAIVPVYDLGCFADQRPFFTMKLVEGHTLAALLQHRTNADKDLSRLLGVFEQVCQAMAYAHARGVVHRDLKPANIMVGAFGEVQVMDWGFAKQTDKETRKQGDREIGASASSLPLCLDGVTQSGVLMGTPAYMPPEQARGESALIDSRADVFALGAILCEILTGRPPYVGTTADEVCRQAAEGNLGDAQSRLEVCGADEFLQELAKRCLAAERSARPSDAGVMAAELTAYTASAQERLRQAQLERAKAEARAEAAGAKAKAERRTRQLTLALAAAMLVGAALTTWQAVVANRAKHDAVSAATAEKDAKDAANTKEAETRAVLGFVEDRIFAAARPTGLQGGLGPDVTLRAAIHASLPFVDKQFKNQPQVEARLRMTLGNSFWYLGDPDSAARQYEAARTLYMQCFGLDDFRTLQCMNDLAISYAMQGRFADAAALNEETLAKRQARLGPDAPETLQSRNNLAMSYFDLGRYNDAIKLHQETLAIQQAKLGPHHRSTLRTMTNLANNYGALGQHSDALKLREETVALQITHLGPKDYDTLMGMHNLANTYRELNRYSDALELDRKTLELRKATLTAEHPDTINSMWSVAKDLIKLDRGTEAVPILDECLQRAVGKRVHRNFEEVADLRLRHFEKANDANGCRTTAEMWEKLQRTDANSLYAAACFRAVTAAVLQAKNPPEAVMIKLADEQDDQAMAWLKQAVAAGYKDVAKINDERDFDRLRNRPDFQKLLAGLNKIHNTL